MGTGMTSRRGELLGEPRQTFLKGHFVPVVTMEGAYWEGPWLCFGRQKSGGGGQGGLRCLASSPRREHAQSQCVEMNLCTTLRRAWPFQVMAPRGRRRWEERGPGDSRELQRDPGISADSLTCLPPIKAHRNYSRVRLTSAGQSGSLDT